MSAETKTELENKIISILKENKGVNYTAHQIIKAIELQEQLEKRSITILV